MMGMGRGGMGGSKDDDDGWKILGCWGWGGGGGKVARMIGIMSRGGWGEGV